MKRGAPGGHRSCRYRPFPAPQIPEDSVSRRAEGPKTSPALGAPASKSTGCVFPKSFFFFFLAILAAKRRQTSRRAKTPLGGSHRTQTPAGRGWGGGSHLQVGTVPFSSAPGGAVSKARFCALAGLWVWGCPGDMTWPHSLSDRASDTGPVSRSATKALRWPARRQAPCPRGDRRPAWLPGPPSESSPH